MKNLIKITLTFCCLLGLLANSANAQKRTNRINKKINKNITKLWPDRAIEEVKIATDKNYELELFFEDNQVTELVDNGTTVGYMLLRRGYGCKIGGCNNSDADGATCSADGGTYEVFDYVVFFDTDLTVLKMNVVDYPGDYGYEICGKNWLKQFIGYKGKKLQYKSDIDGISGATISASSITSDIQDVYTYMNKLVASQNEDLLTKSTAATDSGQK